MKANSVCLTCVWLLAFLHSALALPHLEECRQSGFDPHQLACSTCQILPSELRTRCLECCMEYKVTDRMTKPYEAAVLASVQRSSTEYSDFLQQDWEKLVQEKGKSRLQIIQRNDPYAFYPLLFFFDQPVPVGKSLREYAAMAKETIELDGWKRDDLRDMLQALLP